MQTKDSIHILGVLRDRYARGDKRALVIQLNADWLSEATRNLERSAQISAVLAALDFDHPDRLNESQLLILAKGLGLWST